ncbi:DUF4159 domain-containing protein [Amphiplicatus metriothermophilus]|uniref:N-terminal double-transmembrane domain-containing protein n=1 Tax=Amphiplicatus metriothermophilus TaxID=1519374 RepID=A0A239PSM4_9PROT|nr:DUF4159 domain-containing protein [Amphiplicatus metriothermophilus]MBB5519090.1 hypothetical protein [Amphiplicatus metriothermophilus]SNT73160.1 N-terminal double-transmembrane domain-containing protein [Amphiplicatus metriothermophilus]
MLSLGALSFSAPWILLALAGLPALWLVLRATPPAPKRVRFPAFIILRRLTTKEETPDRTPWWVLLLRLVIAGLVIVGLAGPVLNAPTPAQTTGPLVFAVDDTWAAAGGWRLRLDALAAGAEEAAQAGRPVFLLTTADPAGDPPQGPMTGEAARELFAALAPKPFAADRAGAAARLSRLDPALARAGGAAEIRWLSDGLAGEGDDALAEALAARGALTVYADRETPLVVLRPDRQAGAPARWRVERLRGGPEWRGALVAAARDGRELARAPAVLPAGERTARVAVDLPLALRNEVAAVAIEGARSAGAIQLADARDRRALVGFVAGEDAQQDPLLSGTRYVRKALEPYAGFLTDALDGLIRADVSVIVLHDVGRLRASDAEALAAWVERGGVLIRFAGPSLADAAQDEDLPLLPAPLRGGGRAFGGALTWETPQALAGFSKNGPFADMPPPDDVFVRRQVLAEPGGETSARTWAFLADGTPLVTGARRGDGAIALFHVPATPGWSDLPLSATFVDMLRKLTFLSLLGPSREEADAGARLSPLRVLDGFGRFRDPDPDLAGVTAAEAAAGAAPDRPPGFYGAPEAPIAVNALGPDGALEPLALSGVAETAYAQEPPARLAPPLFAAALALLLLDALVALALAGRLRLAALALLAAASAPASDLRAQPLDAALDPKAVEAALQTRLAYVRTGDPEIDRLSELGLAALSRELYRRTALEPAPPVAVDPETDDLSVYPLLYWPIAAGARPPSEQGLANIENFMRFGGLIIFDTRDDERAVAGLETPERAALRAILAQLDLPPLAALPDDHVLTRSFYLLDRLYGRMWNNPVWVQAPASAAGEANDGVTPVIIGGRDWAGAWATDRFGRPLRPMARGGERARELAYRAGINMAMVAYTGNYKSDQVHAPILLERLGRGRP